MQVSGPFWQNVWFKPGALKSRAGVLQFLDASLLQHSWIIWLIYLLSMQSVHPMTSLFLSVFTDGRKVAGSLDLKTPDLNQSIITLALVHSWMGNIHKVFCSFPNRFSSRIAFYLWTSFQQWALALYFTVKMVLSGIVQSALCTTSSILHLGQKVTFYFLPDLLHLLGLWQTKFSCQEKMSNDYNPRTFSFSTLLNKNLITIVKAKIAKKGKKYPPLYFKMTGGKKWLTF